MSRKSADSGPWGAEPGAVGGQRRQRRGPPLPPVCEDRGCLGVNLTPPLVPGGPRANCRPVAQRPPLCGRDRASSFLNSKKWHHIDVALHTFLYPPSFTQRGGFVMSPRWCAAAAHPLPRRPPPHGHAALPWALGLFPGLD